MSPRVEQQLRLYCDQVERIQEPIDVEEIAVPGVRVDPALFTTSQRLGRFSYAFVAAVVVVALAVVVGGLRIADRTPVGSSPLAPPTGDRLLNPAFLRPIGELERGTYLLAVAGLDISVEVTVGEGWTGSRESITRQTYPESEFGDLDRVVGSPEAVVGISVWEVGKVFGHPCQWKDTLFDPGETVDELADALARIPLRNGSVPLDVSVSGFEGKYLQWSVPDDANFEECDEDVSGFPYDHRSKRGSFFASWVSQTGVDRWQEGPGQIDKLWIMDVNGTRIVIDAWLMRSARDEDLAALSLALSSMEIVAPDG